MLLAVLLTAIAFAWPSPATAGAPDASFGSDGTVIPDLGPAWESAGFGNINPQLDGGAIVTFGAAGARVTESIRRYRGDGSLDTGFVSQLPPAWKTHAIQEDGRVLVAEEGPSASGEVRERLVRFNPDGSLGGFESALVPFNIDAISPEPSGDILVAGALDKSFTGMHGDPGSNLVEPFVARFKSDGTLDAGFGSWGVVDLRAKAGIEGFPLEVHGGPGESAMVSVMSRGGEPQVLVGLNAAGVLDAGFGDGGKVNPDGSIVAFRPLEDGKIVVVVNKEGKSLGRFATASKVFVLRYGADGKPDPAFGSGGIAVLRLAGIDRATAVTWDSDGSILVGSSTSVPTAACRHFYDACTATPVLARFTPEGAPDSSFGIAGKARFDAMAGPASFAGFDSLAVRGGGGYLAAGTSGSTAFLAAVGPSGALDPGFGNRGLVTKRVPRKSTGQVAGIAIDPRGRILLAGRGDAGTAGFDQPRGILARLKPDGSLDRSFGGGKGSLELPADASAVAVDQKGRSLVIENPDNEYGSAAVARVTAAGNLDRSFGDEGHAFVKLAGIHSQSSVLALPDGGVLVGGSVGDAATVYRIGPKGRIVRSFGDRGVASLPFGAKQSCAVRQLAVQADRRILIAGSCLRMKHLRSGGVHWIETMTVARLLSNGSPDRSFGHSGRMPGPVGGAATAIATQGGKILIAARVTTHRKKRSELLIRLTRSGARDRSFARRGIARVAVPTPHSLKIRWCGGFDETASILPTPRRIILVRDGVGPPVLAFRRNGRRDRSFASGNGIAQGREIAPECFPGPVGALQRGSPVLAWTVFRGGQPPPVIALQRLASR